MKVLLIIYVIQYTVYFTFGSIIFLSCHCWCSKGKITIKRKIRKIQAYKYWSPQGVVDHSEGGKPPFVSHWFFCH